MVLPVPLDARVFVVQLAADDLKVTFGSKENPGKFVRVKIHQLLNHLQRESVCMFPKALSVHRHAFCIT